MSTVSDLKERRDDLLRRVGEIDAVLRQLGANPSAPVQHRSNGRGATPAQLAGLAKARKAREAKLRAAAKVPSKPPKRRATDTPKRRLGHSTPGTAAAAPRLQRLAPAQGASLAAAAEG